MPLDLPGGGGANAFFGEGEPSSRATCHHLPEFPNLPVRWGSEKRAPKFGLQVADLIGGRFHSRGSIISSRGRPMLLHGGQPQKLGINIGGGNSARAVLQRPFNLSIVGWAYTYSTSPDSFIWEGADAAWVGHSEHAQRLPDLFNEHGIEFVPAVSGRAFHPVSGPTDVRGICWLVLTDECDSFIW